MPCTTILVGKKASYDGSTMIARNDDSGAGHYTSKKFVVIHPEEQPRTYKTEISHLTIELPDNPMRYTAVPNAEKGEGVWAASGVNAAQVGMTATETITSNPRVLGADPLVVYQPAEDGKEEVPGGIGEEDLVYIVLPYIKSAREGVKRLGSLLEQYGTYEMNGIAFQDHDEIWWLETIGGHHWMAVKVPDDHYVAMPNQLGIDHFDLEDALGEQKEYMCSADLEEFVKTYHLDLSQDGEFHPRDAFGSHDDADHVYNTPRAWFLLRYFNPIGAHESGMIGEDPKGIPNNLLPYVAQVAVGKLESVGVFGDDYPTHDGTGVRDYIHVVDLARGHVAALDWMGGKVGTGEAKTAGTMAGEPAADGTRRGVGIFNLGTGTGSSVLDVVHSFERACGRELPYQIKPRRAGDVAVNYAACDKARDELGWVAQYDLDRMCADGWRWQSQNPDGYATARA